MLELKYFALKPTGSDIYAKASRRALVAYADCIVDVDPEMAQQLNAWASKETPKTQSEIVDKYNAGDLTWEQAYSLLCVTYQLYYTDIIKLLGTHADSIILKIIDRYHKGIFTWDDAKTKLEEEGHRFADIINILGTKA